MNYLLSIGRIARMTRRCPARRIVAFAILLTITGGWYAGGQTTPRAADDAAMFAASLADPDFAKAWSFYRAGEYAKAYDLFTALLRNKPDDEGINMAVALCARKAGRLSHASLAYERILTSKPGNLRARAELGRIYFDQKQYALARECFDAVLKANPGDDVAVNIKRYLDLVDTATRHFEVGLRIETGVFYDSNVNAGPRATTIEIFPISTGLGTIDTLTVNSNSQPAKAYGGFVTLSPALAYDIGRHGGWRINFAGSYYGTRLDDHHDYELDFYGAAAGITYRGRDFALQVPLRAEHLSRGYDDLVNIYAITPLLGYNPVRTWLGQLQLNYEKRDYYDLDTRDSDYLQAAPTVKYSFAGDHTLMAAGSFFREMADAEYYSNAGWEASLTAELRIWSSTILYGKGLFRDTLYDERETLAPEARHDRQWQGTTGIRWMYSLRNANDFALDLGYQHIDTSSTFDIYEYRRDLVTLSTTWRW